MAQAATPEVVMAIAVINAKRRGEKLQVADISERFLELQAKGLDVGDVALRKIPGGVYSEDVEAFVGRFLAAGFAKARSPIDFLDEGIQVCRAIVDNERQRDPAALRATVEALGVNLADLSA